MIIQGMFGLGDNVYQRAFLKNINKPVFLETSWPQFYKDIPSVELIKPDVKLRTQRKNVDRMPASIWTNKQRYAMGQSSQRIYYGDKGILEGMRRCFRVNPDLIDLPDFGPSLVDGKYAVIRPVTIRKEWQNEARAPKPEYIAEAMQILRDDGYKLVSVADLEEDKEWMVGQYPSADIEFHKGELMVEQLMSLCAHSQLMVGGVGWIVPVGVAYNIPTWVIGGGHGAFNAPDLVLPKHQKHKVSFVLPEKYCKCRDHFHKCNKVINNHVEKFTRWLRG
jgi:hypothetical protein